MKNNNVRNPYSDLELFFLRILIVGLVGLILYLVITFGV